MTLLYGTILGELLNRVSTIERCLAVKGLLNPELRVNDGLNVIIEDEEETKEERCDYEEEDVLPWGENDPGA